MERRVLVVGGGIVGLSCAYFLSRRGARVTVLERERVGAGSTPGASGWIAPAQSAPLPGPGLTSFALRSLANPDSPLYLHPRAFVGVLPWLFRFWTHCNARDNLRGLRMTAELNRRTFTLYDQLLADGVDVNIKTGGMLFAARSVEASRHALEKLRPMADYGYQLPEEPMTGAELLDFEPGITPAVKAGFHVREDRYVDPRALLESMARAATRIGVEVRENAPVTGFVRHGHRVTAARTATGDVPADDILLAAGSWTRRVGATLGINVPLQAGKGYSFSVIPRVMPRRPVLLVDAMFAGTPLANRMRLAGTMEFSGLNTRIDQRRIDAILRTAAPCFHGWESNGLQDVWTGMRPITPDGLPILGRALPYENVFLATGHAMNGLTLGPATGEAMTELITSGRTPTVLTPFQLDRFRRFAG